MKHFKKNPGESTQRIHDAKRIAIAATASLATIAALAGGGVATAYGVENLNSAKAEYSVALGESNKSSKALKDAIDSANKLTEDTKDTDVSDPNTSPT